MEIIFNFAITTSRGGAVVARWAHNPKVAGSSPAPATKSTVSQAVLLNYSPFQLSFTCK